jgi:hypothetical protein
MDYVIDDIPLEANFNIQLGESYNGLGDVKKILFGKANQLLNQKIKMFIFKNNSGFVLRVLAQFRWYLAKPRQMQFYQYSRTSRLYESY